MLYKISTGIFGTLQYFNGHLTLQLFLLVYDNYLRGAAEPIVIF